MKKWTPDKVTAVILIAGCLGLLFTGIDGEVKSILTIAAGYLFATGIAERKK
uniref:Holin n=1 Tax=viral metagenome TaxID=1070528 RepID=A0A6H2A1R6_9ZZZZ